MFGSSSFHILLEKMDPSDWHQFQFRKIAVCMFFGLHILIVTRDAYQIRRIRRKTKQQDIILKTIFDNYNPAIPPNYNDDEPLTVDIQVYILSIDSMSDLSKDFAMSIFLRQRWTDKRLKYDRIEGVPALQLNTKSINGVWVPDLFILNEKRATLHNVVVPNKLLHIQPDGSILYSIRISGTFSCDVDLLKYPLDNQICPLIIESYGYTSETLELQWYKEAVEKKEDIILSQFSLDCIETFKCDKQYAGMNFSCVQMNIKLDRLYDYYLLQIYVPSILIVILSWVSFWISVDATPARISLGLLTVLAMTTQSSGLPKVSYFKAIDVWMVSCLCFVFAALIEFAYVNVLSRVEQRRLSHVVDITNNKTEDIRRSLPEKMGNQTSSRINLFFRNMASREKARNVDKISRVIFPMLFLLFNVIYWTVYIFD